jgi:hypothetical protein
MQHTCKNRGKKLVINCNHFIMGCTFEMMQHLYSQSIENIYGLKVWHSFSKSIKT